MPAVQVIRDSASALAICFGLAGRNYSTLGYTFDASVFYAIYKIFRFRFRFWV